MNVSRADVPWSWKGVLLAPIELLAIAWSIPLAVLLVAAPIALFVALLVRLGQFVSDRF